MVGDLVTMTGTGRPEHPGSLSSLLLMYSVPSALPYHLDLLIISLKHAQLRKLRRKPGRLVSHSEVKDCELRCSGPEFTHVSTQLHNCTPQMHMHVHTTIHSTLTMWELAKDSFGFYFAI